MCTGVRPHSGKLTTRQEIYWLLQDGILATVVIVGG